MSKLFNWAAARLAAAFALALPLAAMAVTTEGYTDFGDTAGVVLWRAIGSDFHNSRVRNVAADGTVGDEYAMVANPNNNTTSWQRFASNMANAYTSPGLVLVYDLPGDGDSTNYSASVDCSFGPLSFGGLWVKTLAANDAVFTIKGTGSRSTEFGAAGKSTLFKFEKSFTINRQGTSSFCGTATVDIDAGATFTAQAYSGQVASVPVDSTLKLKGSGTLAVTTMNVAGALDLSATTVPSISGNVTLAGGATLVLPAGTTIDGESPFTICSGTLTASDNVYVKIGDGDAVLMLLTVSGGAITATESVTTELTFTEDFPDVVPFGCVYTFIGGETTDALVTLSAVTVNGTLKTSKYIKITDIATSVGSALEVLDGVTTVGGSADCKIKGSITIDAGATLKNIKTDSLNYNSPSLTVDVYGTLDMGTTRWSVREGVTFKVHPGAAVTGAGDSLASLDFLSGNGIDVYGGAGASSVTIEGPVRVRGNESRFWVDENMTLVLAGGIKDGSGHHGGFKQVGPGTLEIHANSVGLSGNASIMTQGTLRLVDTTLAFPVELQGSSSYLEVVATGAETNVPVKVTSIANNNVTFSGDGKVSGSITKTSAPGGNLATALQSSAWTGTFVADWAGAKDAHFDINSYGNANSVVEVTKLAGGHVSGSNANVTVVPTVKVSGTMKLDNGYSGKTTTFTKLTGTGTFTQGGIYPIDITVLDGFTGTIVGEAAGGTSIGTINLSETPSAGGKLFSISPSAEILYGFASTKVSVNGVVDDTIKIEAKSDGIYVKSTVTITVPAVANATATATIGGEPVALDSNGQADVPAGSVVTVTYAANEGYVISGTTEYTIDTANATTFELDESTKTGLIVAQIRTGATSYEYYTTLADALDSENVAYGITLRANIDEDEVTISSPVMITGNYTINSDIKVVAGGQLQLMLVTMAGTLTIEENGIYATGGGTLNELVTKDGAKIQLTTLSDTAAPLAVTTLSVEGDLTIISTWGSAVRDTYYKALSYVTANADIAEGATVDSVNEWSAKVEADGDYTIVYLAITKVATVDGVYYDDAQDAVDAAVASGKPVSFLVAPGTVTLGAGETLVVSGATLPTVVLDDDLTTPPYEIAHTIDTENLTNTYAVKAYVAQITRSEYSQELGPQNVTYKFESIAEAVESANAGETIKVIADNTLTGSIGVTKNLTLDLNGFTVTGAAGDSPMFNLGEVSFTITDTSESKAGKAVSAGSKVILSGSACTITLTAGTLESGDVPVYLYEDLNSVLNINGGKIVCSKTSGYAVSILNGTVNMTAGEVNSTCSGFYMHNATVSGGTIKIGSGSSWKVFYDLDNWTTTTVTGGTFNRDVSEYCVSGKICVPNGDGTYTVRAGKWIAKIGDTKYESLAEAVAAAEAGQTVTMLADDRVSFAAVTVEDGVPSGGSIVIDKNLTIDGSGFTVYGNTNADILNATGSATPGYDMVADLVDGSNLLGFFVKSGNVTFQNVTLTEFGNTAYVNKFGYTPIQTASAYTGKLTLTNVNFNKFNRTAVCVRGGTLEMTGGTVSGGTVNKNNGDYFQQPLEVRGGTATISGVTITGGDDVAGNGGGAIVAWGDTTVNNVNIDFTGIGVWADVANVAITGDDTKISATTQSVFVEEGGSATIAAGDFAGSLAVDSEANSSIAVSGGTFDAAVPAEYCATGYEPKDNGDGTYTVRVDLGWIYEAADHPKYTGSWSNEVEYVNGKAHIEDGNTYTANRPSDGRMVTVEMTLSFDDVNDEDETVGDAKAAVKLATGGFKVYTSEGPDEAVTSVWKYVAIEGSDMIPVAEQDYKFLFVLDLTNTTYTAALVTGDGAVTNALVLADGSVANIPFASRGNVAPVQQIEFIGSGSVTSIEGSYEDAPAPVDEFVNGQEIGSVTLDTAQAAWLNGQNNYAALRTKIATMSQTAFDAAYLLNLDILSDFTYEFKVSDITVGDTTVSVKVTLTRNGEIDDPIIGTLKLTGTDELGNAFTVKDSATISDAHFSAGDGEVTISFPKDASTKFFQPVIE